MRLGQVKAFTQARTQTLAKPAAAHNSHQRLRQLITLAQRIAPWVQKRRHTRHTVRCSPNQQPHSAQYRQHQHGEIFPREACQKQHAHSNHDNHDKRTKIRLQHN